MRLQNQVAIVTGGANGIGEGISRRFAAEGAHVVIVDTAADSGSALVADIDAAGGSSVFVEADVSDELPVERAVERALRVTGRINCLVNNAGILRFTPWPDLSRADWDRILDVNLTGTMLFSRAVIPHMMASSGGSIINMSSIHATLTGPAVAAYAATKGALITFTRSMAIELGPSGIRVNAILPGYIDTPLFRSDAERVTGGRPQEFIDSLEKRIPLRRVGTPADIAGAAVFLASSDAAYVNGCNLAVDAGTAVQL